ncbi:MAG: thioredoxin domain-containing protein [Candidatus Pacebacteria bacterium]|nr:thioredoxin domain-containing protein [Candidatus Paceibacterota bacterium]
MEDNKYIVPLAIIIAALLIGWGFYSTSNNSDTETDTPISGEEIPVDPTEIGFQASDHILGDSNAKIKIITFSDFECPYCKIFHETMTKITDKYAKDGTVAWAFREFPVHGEPTEIKAAAAECAGQLGGESAFWAMATKIFETSGSSWINVEKLPALAVELGINENEFNNCLKNEEIIKKVQSDFNNGIDFGVEGTPASIVILATGDVFPMTGNQPYEAIEGMIELVLSEEISL